MPKQARQIVSVVISLIVLIVVAQRTTTVLEVGPGSNGGAQFRVTPAEADAAGTPVLDSATRAAGLTFGPGVSPLDAQAINAAIAGARPEARQLIDLVDGMTTIDVGATGAGALGSAGPRGVGEFQVTLDMPRVYALGKRGISRVVLHELGHVIDFAIVPDTLIQTLDAGIPEGWPCPPGTDIGSCAPLEERFAESFAKWATGDIGVDLYAGYAVPPPAQLDVWGAPLAQLGA